MGGHATGRPAGDPPGGLVQPGEADYRLLVEHLHAGVVVHGPDTRILLANRQASNLLGLSMDQMQGRAAMDPYWSFVREDESVLPFEDYPVNRVIATAQPLRDLCVGINRPVTRDRVWVLANAFPEVGEAGALRRVVVTFVDITQRKRAEEALRESEEKLRALSANLADGMVYQVGSGPDGVGRIFTYVSPAVERLHGLTVEALTRDASLLYGQFLEEDRARVAGLEARALATRTKLEVDVRIRLPTGEVRWRRFTSSPHVAADGSVLWNGIELDITGHKLAEEERLHLQTQLIQAQKMESIGRLAGGVAHDFNNMLQAIMGNALLALDALPADSPARDHLLEIRRSAERSADLTRQLLAFARKQPVQPRVLDLNDTVAKALKMLRRLLGEDLELVWSPGAELWPIKADPSQLDSVLANLCVNARDACAGTGRVAIETRNVVLDEAFAAAHPDAVPGPHVLLSVRDNGHGMDEETLARVFEPFFTTKELGKGTGLGLATVFGMVRQSHGVITVESEPGRGTIFRIYLPRAVGAAVAACPAPPDSAPGVGGRETILLVEDEAPVLDLCRQVLEQQEYRVLTAGSPAAALALATQYAGRIDLLLTDVVMPGMNGRELYERLKLSRPETKCLFMSGYTADLLARHGVAAGNVNLLPKPFANRELAERLRDLLSRA